MSIEALATLRYNLKKARINSMNSDLAGPIEILYNKADQAYWKAVNSTLSSNLKKLNNELSRINNINNIIKEKLDNLNNIRAVLKLLNEAVKIAIGIAALL
ncbi:hypothetical protein QS468_48020 [Bacillus subtilis]|nr:hypothetical protein [Pseudomonas sp. A29(2023)]MDL5600529.1 hypothetical protein [Bacillus subtilis]